ncbi:type I-U CRISPR-associated RAMP protein Csb1/Cas7u [Kytococcus schroeteri]|nr:type I-U CRISPR-associated RAMP protein Csb1/Cas7u [Kytococcus schroeteri]
MRATRTTYTIPLTPVAGDRFQPTGFPDLGPAEFSRWDADRKDWVNALHVESPQSMANRLEATTWLEGEDVQPSVLEGLPYVQVVEERDGEDAFVTCSRREAHRLASAYVMNAVTETGETGRDWLMAELGAGKDDPANRYHQVHRAVLRMDPLSLVHGVFFAQKDFGWQPKVARAVTSFIDATNVRPAHSGGVKTDVVRTTASEGAGSKEGYGMVPHQRLEFTAEKITAYVTVDHEQIRSYALGDEGTELLESLVEYELAVLFSGGLRLRTACDFQVITEEVLVSGEEGALPQVDTAEKRVRAAIEAARGAGLLGDVTTLRKVAR